MKEKKRVKRGIYKFALRLPDGTAWLVTPAEGRLRQLFVQDLVPTAPTTHQGTR